MRYNTQNGNGIKKHFFLIMVMEIYFKIKFKLYRIEQRKIDTNTHKTHSNTYSYTKRG